MQKKSLCDNAPRVFVVVGPTSAGKSDFAVQLARKVGGEIISADSRQVYRQLNIGTGKISRRDMRGIRHHLLDVASPKKIFTAHDFVQRGQKALADIIRRGKVPIVCGGSGFYIDALLGRVTLSGVPANMALRAKLSNKTASQLYATLNRLDRKRARVIDERNPVRLIRAIEIAKGRSKFRHKITANDRLKLLCTWIGLKPDDKTLRKRIHDRLEARIKQGMIAEARNLHRHGLSHKRMEQLGLEYRYLARHLRGEITTAEMSSILENEIWQYSKRQMTYWRRNKDIVWFESRDAAFTWTQYLP